jgi:hypothetical protein
MAQIPLRKVANQTEQVSENVGTADDRVCMKSFWNRKYNCRSGTLVKLSSTQKKELRGMCSHPSM